MGTGSAAVARARPTEGDDMTVRDTPWPEGTPCWAELAVPDLELGRQFYGALLGWEFAVGPAETGFYSEARVGGRRAAALTGYRPDPDAPVAWLPFLAPPDAARLREAIDNSLADLAAVLPAIIAGQPAERIELELSARRADRISASRLPHPSGSKPYSAAPYSAAPHSAEPQPAEPQPAEPANQETPA